uniref:Uncharacterized protein n=1 Tax=Amphimedon queenslandica TaxID=400682 RepID=A0A1X7U707_AMPQE
MLKLILKPDMTYFKDVKGRTPLHYAAAMDRVHVCYHLLNKGADASQKDSDNKTPLDYTLIKQHEFVVALFTCHDASVGDFIKMQRSSSSLLFLDQRLKVVLVSINQETQQKERDRTVSNRRS